MAVLFKNNASATLASSITTSSTSIVLTSGQGAQFPAISGSDYFYATLTDSSNNLEIIKVTGRVTDTLTVVRAQEGTTARAYNAADRLELRVTAAGLGNMAQLDSANTFSGANSFTAANTFSNGTGFSLGTAAAPALYFIGDTNTGVYSPGADQISITVGGIGRVFVDSLGQVGIGQAPGKTFDVAGSGRFTATASGSAGAVILRQDAMNTAGAYVQWVDSANSVEKGWIVVDTSTNMKFATGSTQRAVIDNNGNFGVNTATPGTYGKLVTYATDTNNGLVVVADSSALRMRGYSSAGAGATVEATTANLAAYAMLTVGGSSVNIATGGVGRLIINAAGDASFTGALSTQGTFSIGTSSASVSGNAPMFMCRAWVNFDGTGSIGVNQTINASGNVSSVVKNATGDYTITFSTVLPTSSYVLSGMTTTFSASGNINPGVVCLAGDRTSGPTLKSTSQVNIKVVYGTAAGSTYDWNNISVMILC